MQYKSNNGYGENDDGNYIADLSFESIRKQSTSSFSLSLSTGFVGRNGAYPVCHVNRPSEFLKRISFAFDFKTNKDGRTLNCRPLTANAILVLSPLLSILFNRNPQLAEQTAFFVFKIDLIVCIIRLHITRLRNKLLKKLAPCFT